MISKIGITLSLPKTIDGLFTNGIRQNALFFSELLLNIGKYDVCFIIDNLIIDESLIQELRNKFRFNYIKYNDLLNYKFDIIFTFGFNFTQENYKLTRQMGTKNIYYNCGSLYITNSEWCLFSEKEYTFAYERHNYFDECWNIPQSTNTNHYYIKTLLRCDVIEVPFIWSPVLINDEKNKYVKRSSEKSIVIFEPNLSMVKWSFPALLVCENAYRDKDIGNKIDKVYITNIETNERAFNFKNFNKIVMPLDLKKDNKLSIEGRYNSLYFMSKYTDIVVSHTWENGLNYLYLDIAWMGWPIVHNGHFCKEVGYYYDEFNYEMGGNVLKDAILNHDENAEEYLLKNRLYIQKYLPTNKELKKQYETLISNCLSSTNNSL